MSAASPTTIATDPARSTAASNDWPALWQTLSQGVGVGRYTDPQFTRLEFEKLWSRVWQVAARIDEIPEQGDYTTYRIGDQSILLVRVDESTIKAFYNFCPHRGTTLGHGCGHFDGGKIICPYHGWRWDLQGNIKLVLERNEFCDGKLQDGDVAMREVHSRVFAGFVFINLDPNPESFDDFIAPLRQFLDDIVLGDMRHIWWKRTVIPCNWKVAQEAFYEAYHVSATHPQLEKVGREVVYGDRPDGPMMYRDLTYDAFEHGHGQFYGGDKTPMAGHVQEPKSTDDLLEEMAARMNLTAEGLGAMILKEDIELLLTLRGKHLPPGTNLGAEYVRLQYETAAKLSRPMPKPTPEIIGRWGGALPGSAARDRSQPVHVRDSLRQDLSCRGENTARRRRGHHRPRAGRAHSAAGSRQSPAGTGRPALHGHEAGMVGLEPGKADPEHAPRTRSLPAVLKS